ncbi:hypothetical protein [Brevibacterium moorei]|uniref:hypothetical protein n=1 Tax=Brevibacterium moorei TaxID=2968457 RepID=UPI00211CD5B5|nr:hypothetical protein [Brevibacterium sp. 68QC2CO]MCQ9386802.1 hypothetical protein [Brevibacterium sp. 68QC2CO]
MNTTYAPHPVKRQRRTQAELAALDEAILTACRLENPLTVRSCFYRVVSAGGVEKTERGYAVVQRRLLKLRQEGRVPYTWVTDAGRALSYPLAYHSLADRLNGIVQSYRRDLWDFQQTAVIALVEKDGLLGVVDPVADEYGVPLGATKGYASESFNWEVADRIKRFGRRQVHVFNIGDHDPSGVNAWESFCAKTRDFAPQADIVFQRIAVTPEQIEQYGLLTRPTKKTDSRAKAFEGESVEADALSPSDLRGILRTAIESVIDHDKVAEALAIEQAEKLQLQTLIEGAE